MNISSLSINRPVLATVISFVLVGANAQIHAQTDEYDYSSIKQRRIKLQPIDTTNAVIVHTATAVIYFSKADVCRRIEQTYPPDVFRHFTKKISDHDARIVVWIDNSDSTLTRALGMNFGSLMRFVAADLLLEGKARPFIKTSDLAKMKAIRCANERGEPNVWPRSRRLVFRTLAGTEIYGVVTSFPE